MISFEMLIFYGLIVVCILQSIFYFVIYGEVAFKSDRDKKKSIPNLPALSVILYIKNFKGDINKSVKEILDQDYPDFEVILLNDNHAIDDMFFEIKNLETEHEKVKVVNIERNERFWNNKRYALTLGIKATKHDYLVFTEPDCSPASKNWLKQFGEKFSNKNISVILGYSNIRRARGFFSLFIQFENFKRALRMLSFARIGIPYIGNRQNMAYRKSDFLKIGGFMKFMNIKSAENTLFIDQLTNNKNTTICTNSSSFVYHKCSNYLKYLSEFRVHDFNCKKINFGKRLLLFLLKTSDTLFWIFTILLIILEFDLPMVIIIVFFRFLMTYILFGFATFRLKTIISLLFFPVFELASILLSFIFIFANIFSKPKVI